MLPQTMELRHLRYFLQVAKELSFTKAGLSLRVAQPALSRQIRQLEEEIGANLFERSRKQVKLTQAGEAFLSEAEGILARAQTAIQQAREAGKSHEGTLNLGYVWGLFHTEAPARIGSFRHEHPGAAIHLFDLPATEQAISISKGKLDGGFIGFADEADASGLARRQIGCCSFLIALPEKHPAATKRKIPLKLLIEEQFLLISDRNYPGAARIALEACERAGFRPKILQNPERGHTILSLVAANCGVALLPSPLKSLPHAGVTFRGLAEPLEAPLYFAWHPSRTAPLLEAFTASLPLHSSETYAVLSNTTRHRPPNNLGAELKTRSAPRKIGSTEAG